MLVPVTYRRSDGYRFTWDGQSTVTVSNTSNVAVESFSIPFGSSMSHALNLCDKWTPDNYLTAWSFL